MGHSVECSDALELTSSIEVITCIVSDHYVRLIHHPVMTNSVFLQGLHIQDSDFDRPQARNSKQYYLITPKISPEQQV